MTPMNDFELCGEVFNYLERGLNIIKTYFSLGSVEEKEAIIEETEELLRMAVAIEPLVATAAPEDGVALITNSRLY